METTGTVVSRPKRGRWAAAQKLAVLEEWRGGVPVEELCRRHSLSANRLYRWRQTLERGLADHGALVPKSQVTTLQRRVDDLEKALGRKALEIDVLKKVFELKGLPLPEGF